MEGWPLGKMDASKGSKGKRKLIIEVVGNERLRILLDFSVDYSLFIMYTIYLLIDEPLV